MVARAEIDRFTTILNDQWSAGQRVTTAAADPDSPRESVYLK
jgi:hypothetical protein